VLGGGSYQEDMRDPLRVDSWWWVGVVAGVEFLAVGVGVLVLVTALARTWPSSAVADVARIAGVTCGVAFLALAATYLVSHSWWAMPDTADYSSEAEVRGAIGAALAYVGLIFVALACLGTAVWAVGVVVLSRRLGHLGRVSALTVGVIAAIIGLGTLAQMAIPFAVLHIVLWLTLGVRLVRTPILPPPLRRTRESVM
jgi:hypothetical protein